VLHLHCQISWLRATTSLAFAVFVIGIVPFGDRVRAGSSKEEAISGLIPPPALPSATPNPNCLPDSLCPDWTSRYNGQANGSDRGIGTVTSPDGSRVYVTGHITTSSGTLDFATIGYDAATGTQLWVTTYDGPAGGSDQPYFFGTGHQITISADGSALFVVGLSARSDGLNDFVTIAYRASDGAQLWVSRYSTPRDSLGSSLALGRDGKRLYVTGYSSIALAAPPAPGAENYDFATIAYDTATGDELWISRYDGPASFWDIPYAIGVGNVRQSDGSRREEVFVTGRSNGASSDNSQADFATVAYDGLTGTQLWVSRYDGPAHDRDLAYGLAVSPDGSSVLVTGESAGNGADYATICYDALTGTQRWLARYDNGSDDLPLDIIVSPAGGTVAVTGFSVNPIAGEGVTPLRDAATILYDVTTGSQVWVARHSEVDGAATSRVTFSHDGRRIYIAGLQNGNVVGVGVGGGGVAGQAGTPALTVAYDASGGTELWATHYSGASGDEGNYGVAVSPDDAHVFVTGGGQTASADIATLSFTTGAPTPPPVQLARVVSRKTHFGAGAFDIVLDCPACAGAVAPEVECRSGGATGDYTVVFTFSTTLTSVGAASVTSGTGSVSSSAIDDSDAHNYIVNLTGVSNAQMSTVNLSNVYDSAGNGSRVVSAAMGVLLGDVNSSRRVDAADVSSVRQQTLQTVDATNFRNDINVSGRIDAADVSIARQQSLTSLP
jgi:hypothetical protein